jgi:hypothetical protein
LTDQATIGKEVFMGIRSLLIKGAVVGALAAGSFGLTAGAAHASPASCRNYAELAAHYSMLANIDYNNYLSVVGTAGGEPAAGYYLDQFGLDSQRAEDFSMKFNICSYETP